jgi:hypothetical protein
MNRDCVRQGSASPRRRPPVISIVTLFPTWLPPSVSLARSPHLLHEACLVSVLVCFEKDAQRRHSSCLILITQRHVYTIWSLRQQVLSAHHRAKAWAHRVVQLGVKAALW